MLLSVQTRDVDHSILKGGGFLALPDAAGDGHGSHPGVVVIHEAYGLNDNIKDITRRFAESGYVALAVDLFADRNKALCMARYMAGMLRGSVDRPGVPDLKLALSHLMTLPEVDPQRVGAIGFCMGGSFAIAWACTDERLKAIAPFYASNPKPLAEAVARLCPVVGSYPGRDFTARAGRDLAAELTRRQIEHDIKIYPDARHSFFSPGRSFNEAAAADSWKRVMEFFSAHLVTPEAKAKPKTQASPAPAPRRSKQKARP
jgi:carboxymethylenebutenolidase